MIQLKEFRIIVDKVKIANTISRETPIEELYEYFQLPTSDKYKRKEVEELLVGKLNSLLPDPKNEIATCFYYLKNNIIGEYILDNIKPEPYFAIAENLRTYSIIKLLHL